MGDAEEEEFARKLAEEIERKKNKGKHFGGLNEKDAWVISRTR